MKNLSLKYSLPLVLFIALLVGLLSCSKDNDEPVIDNTLRYLPGVYPDSTITDGPFIFDNGNRFTVKWIEKNRTVQENTIVENDDGRFEASFGFPFDFVKTFIDEPINNDYVQEFTNVKNLVALSDIHGQYGILVSLLKNNGVIDKNYNWVFGSGHLVINGDIFDRGDRVTEILWLIFKLENQARVMGGKVHYLLGNHEIMVLNNDLRYVSYKYATNSRRLGTTYDQLYSKNTVIGKWLRTKAVIVKINDMVFNHSGISPDFVQQNLSLEIVNRAFQEDIIDVSDSIIDADPLLDFLTGSNGPIWYRGYFEDNSFSIDELNVILNHLAASYIIVGHTSMDEIKFYYSGKVIAIDSKIKEGMTGQVLIYDNGSFRIGTEN